MKFRLPLKTESPDDLRARIWREMGPLLSPVDASFRDGVFRGYMAMCERWFEGGEWLVVEIDLQRQTCAVVDRRDPDGVVKHAIEKLNEMRRGDPERDHGDADDILLDVLRAKGLGAVADAFEIARGRVGFWYA